MGTVYRARDPILDRPVALKTIASKALEKADVRARFEREARAAARLQHPNIVTIYELGETDGVLFIAMELLEGMDLTEAMTPADRLTMSQKLRVTIDICRGLDFAHKRGVLHRDVKPANVRILKDGSLKIVDFGIARVDDQAMTQTGIVLGTPGYMAPETLRGTPVDHRADMWAVGIVLYELLAGARPFQAESFASLAYKIVFEAPPALALRDPPPGLVEVLGQALAKPAADRFRDLAQMADALEVVLGLTPSGERPPTADARREQLAAHVDLARQLVALDDLEAALNEARCAQALDPSSAFVVELLKDIDRRLGQAPGAVATVIAAATQPFASTPLPADGPPITVPVRAAAPGFCSLVGAKGAAAFREIALFGEPPATATTALAPDADRFALAGTDGAIRLWSLRTRTRVAALRSEMHQRTGHDAVALSLAFSRDGRYLASGHVDGAVRLWDLGASREVPVKLKHEAMVAAVAFAPSGAALASGGMDSNVKLWDVAAALAGEARRELHRQPFGVTAMCYAGAEGQLLVTGHAKAVLRVVDANSGRLVATLRGPEAQISLLVPVRDGRTIAALSQDRTIRLFDLESRAETLSVPGHRTKQTTALAFFPDGPLAASVALDNAVFVWDLVSQAPVTTFWGPTGEGYLGLAMSRDAMLAAALTDGRIRLWGPAA